MNTLTSPAIQQWAADWADAYDQKMTEDDMNDLVGKTVDAEAEDSDGNPKGFKGLTVIGYSTDKVFFKSDEDAPTESVHRRSVVTADGKQIAVLSGMTFTEASLEDEG